MKVLFVVIFSRCDILEMRIKFEELENNFKVIVESRGFQ